RLVTSWTLDGFHHEHATQHHGARTMLKSASVSLLAARANRVHSAAQAGFSLVEMLVVLTIIALVLGLVGPRVLNYLGESRSKTAKLQIESFGSALDLFYLDTGRYPTSSEGLGALVQRPTGVEIWNGPYVKGGRLPSDPWGHPYQYRSPVERAAY